VNSKSVSACQPEYFKSARALSRHAASSVPNHRNHAKYGCALLTPKKTRLVPLGAGLVDAASEADLVFFASKLPVERKIEL